MRGAKALSVVVRCPNGSLATNTRKLHSVYTGKWRRIPFCRGVIALLEAMILGMQSIMFSTNVALENIDPAKDDTVTKKDTSSLKNPGLWIMLVLSMVIAVGLFSILPLFLSGLVLPGQQGSIQFNLLEGIIRLLIFIAYLFAVSFLPDIRRVFAYHGAEHKTINAFEAGDELTLENVQKHSICHTRCGTAFLLAVMIIAIFVFSLVGKQTLWLLVSSRTLLMPVIASIAFEATQLMARNMNNIFVRVLATPGLLLQKLTTRQPDAQMLEVAIAALKEVLNFDKAAEETTPTLNHEIPQQPVCQ